MSKISKLSSFYCDTLDYLVGELKSFNENAMLVDYLSYILAIKYCTDRFISKFERSNSLNEFEFED